MTVSIKSIVKNAYDNWKDKNFAIEKNDGENVATSYGEFLRKADAVAKELVRMGLKG